MTPRDAASGGRWDIFCRVVDNVGDIGVCWRLARILANEHRLAVRLWVDDLAWFRRLCPHASGVGDALQCDGVDVRRWAEPFAEVVTADVVIEAFACEPPAGYVAAMAAREHAPWWINLEYLSAEAWIDGVHGMRSPHPRVPLVKHFFCPGFSPRSGGLLRERGLLDERDRFCANPAQVRAFVAAHARGDGVDVDVDGGGHDDALRVSLFAYGHPDLPALLEAWARGARRVHLRVPEGRVVADVARYFGCTTLAVGERRRAASLVVDILPFVSQHDYDRLLWHSELNFVRGEDSFVRAQWAGQPFVWQIYPQDGRAHHAKLEAFLSRYLATADEGVANPVRAFWWAWNGVGDLLETWPAFAEGLVAQRDHCRAWCAQLAAGRELAAALVKFVEVTVK